MNKQKFEFDWGLFVFIIWIGLTFVLLEAGSILGIIMLIIFIIGICTKTKIKK